MGQACSVLSGFVQGVRWAASVLTSGGLPEPIPVSPATSSAGLFTQKLTYENGVLKMNYTGGDTCHKVYQRSTTIFFYCDRSTQVVSACRVGPRPGFVFHKASPLLTSRATSWLNLVHACDLQIRCSKP